MPEGTELIQIARNSMVHVLVKAALLRYPVPTFLYLLTNRTSR
jgi:hypothetical protein